MAEEVTAIVEMRRNLQALPETTREEFGARQSTALVETAATAVAARERAATEARYIMAMRNPRDIDAFYQSILKECHRPGFAAKARYAKPVGKEFKDGRWIQKTATGPSIRFIEAALRCYKNVYPEVTTVYDSQTMRICRVAVTDLESNVTYATEVQIQKTVERKGTRGKDGGDAPPVGRIVLSDRTNSEGERTYLVVATDDEVLVKQNALLSKSIRTNAQRLLPGDIVDDCMTTVLTVQADADAKDPDAARRRMIEAFSQIGISVSDVSAFLGHSTERIQPKEMQDLRGAYESIKEGEATWNEIMESRGVTGSTEAQADVLTKKLAESQKKITPTQQKNGGVQGETDKSDHGEELTPEQHRQLDIQAAAEEAASTEGNPASRPPMSMRRRP